MINPAGRLSRQCSAVCRFWHWLFCEIAGPVESPTFGILEEGTLRCVVELGRRRVGEVKVTNAQPRIQYAVGATRTEGLSAFGVRAILSKPFEIHELIATVKTILEREN